MKKENEINDTENEDMIENPEIQNEDVEFEEVNDEGEVDIKNTIKKLREKIKILEKEKQEYMSGWQRSQADYVNFKKEVDAHRVLDIKLANRRLIEEILPTLDAYTMARGNKASWEAVDDNWRIGIEYIFGQLNSALEKGGLVQFGEIGEEFNPAVHESISIVETNDEAKDDTIESVLANGYKIGEMILRPAKVKIYQAK